jgi:tRNA1(Val) A37 N6-methylase TrmN6
VSVQDGFLLGGAVRHAQATEGHRTGIEPVLLAACVPARPGQSVLEGGTGSGAGLLCLAYRVAGLCGVGIERSPAQAAMARRNIDANGFAGFSILEGDLAEIAPDGRFDHAFANPPWHAERATASPDAARDLAKRAPEGLFALWAKRLAAPLRHRGTLSFITSAATLSACLAAFTAAGCGSHVILPLWPRAGRPAKLVLLQGVRGGRGATRLLPGLVLHEGQGGYTEAADAVLRRAAPIDL